MQQLPSSQWHHGTAKVWKKYVFFFFFFRVHMPRLHPLPVCTSCKQEASCNWHCTKLRSMPSDGKSKGYIQLVCVYIASPLEVSPFAGTVDVCVQYLHLSACETVAARQVKDQAKPAALAQHALKMKATNCD